MDFSATMVCRNPTYPDKVPVFEYGDRDAFSTIFETGMMKNDGTGCWNLNDSPLSEMTCECVDGFNSANYMCDDGLTRSCKGTERSVSHST